MRDSHIQPRLAKQHRPKSSPEGIQRHEAFDAKGEEEKEAEEDDEEAHERGAPWSEEPPVPPGLADEKEVWIEHKRPLLLLLLLGLLHLRPPLLLLRRPTTYVSTSGVAKPPC